jgi:hypothetical protein
VDVASFLVFTHMQRAGLPKSHMREWWDLVHVLLPADHNLRGFDVTRAHLTDQGGMDIQTLDVCRGGCVIFRNRDLRLDPQRLHQFADADNCPTCHLARYKNAQKRRAYKHFTWIGLNTQLAKRAWHPAWRDAVRILPRVYNCTLLYTIIYFYPSGWTEQYRAQCARLGNVGRVRDAGCDHELGDTEHCARIQHGRGQPVSQRSIFTLAINLQGIQFYTIVYYCILNCCMCPLIGSQSTS